MYLLEAISKTYRELRMSQTELAEQLGTSRQHLSKAMTGGTSEVPKLWKDALEVLGLELVVREKSGG